VDRSIAPAASPDELLDRVQALSDAVDELPDPRARELAHELVGAVVAMYGDGLRRIMATVESAREAGATIMDELAQDGAVASLLLIHDLYPVSLQDRVLEALDSVRPYMESHGGNVELRGIENGVARLSLQGSCHGCAASRSTLELAIKQALDEHAPDLVGLDVDGIEPDEPARPVDPVEEERPVRWLAVDEVGALAPGELRSVAVDGIDLVVANVGGSLLAYRDACAACGEPIGAGELSGPMLRCPRCEVEFDLPRAGRAGGGEPLQLAPVPLLRNEGLRVAV
jgi:Fe-S cluster biogenesis protein NfuA/nitrite reductase/ring-hydroxylating ferredoxin subunit